MKFLKENLKIGVQPFYGFEAILWNNKIVTCLQMVMEIFLELSSSFLMFI